LLAAIGRSGQPALVYVSDVPASVLTHFASNNVRFETERLNIAKITAGCDIAITNAGLATAAMMLRSGKPMFMVPITEEQAIVARLVLAHGAGLGTFPDRPETFAPRLKLVLEDPRYREGAARLSAQLQKVDLAANLQLIIQRTLALL
jgi:UDP:flavonoid glycosyltransferase YjiC (YdhE family)